MGYTYSPDEPRDIDQVRLALSDTTFVQVAPNKPEIGIFQDEEIKMALDRSGDIDGATALLARSLAANATKLSMLIRIEGGKGGNRLEVDRKNLSRWYIDLAKTYEAKSKSKPFTGSVDWEDGNQRYLETQLNRDSFDFEGSE